MTPNPSDLSEDSLRRVWTSAVGADSSQDNEALLRLVKVKTRKFDRRMKARNLVEILASASMILVFGRAAAIAHDAWEAAGNLVITIGLAWIIFYLLRFGRDRSAPNPAQPLEVYRQALTRKFDYQLRLLRNVKYWYLLPLYLGFVVLLIARIRRGGWDWDALAVHGIVTLVFGALWYANEVLAVRALEKRKECLSREH